jgi:hypothetical protein
LKIVLNREIRAHLIDLPERQTALGIIGKLEHSARIAVEVGRQFVRFVFRYATEAPITPAPITIVLIIRVSARSKRITVRDFPGIARGL